MASVLVRAAAMVAASAVPGSGLWGQTQDDTLRLADIVVTATRVPVSRDAVASTISVVSGAELRARGVAYVLDALRDQAGATVVQGGGSYGATTSLFLRGGESDYVKVLLDGVALNGPGGAYDLAHLTTENVDRIEIVRGPTSVLYGSDAVSGVVQIFTRRGPGPASGEAGFGAGSHGSTRWVAGVGGGSDRASYSFSLSRFATDGRYPFNSEYRNLVAGGLIRVAPDLRTEAALSFRHHDHTVHFPTDGGGRLVDRNQFTYEDGTALGLEVSRVLTGRLETRAHVYANQTDGGYDDQPDSPADTLGFYAFESLDRIRTRGADLRANIHLRPGTVLTAGAELKHQADRGFSSSRSQFGGSTDALDLTRRNRAVFTQVLVELAGGAALNLGGRLDDNDAFGTFGTYRIGATARLPRGGGTRLRASLGTGFKEPTFLENYATGFSQGNPDLRPERSLSWEAGIEQMLPGEGLLLSATWFDQRMRDLIQYAFTPTVPGGPNYVNIAGANARGLELEARWTGPRGVQARLSHTYLQSRVTDAGFDVGPDATFVTGERLLRRPSHATALVLSYRSPGRIVAGLTVNRVGARDDRDFAGFPARRLTLPAYATVALSGEYTVPLATRPWPELTVTARVENLFDRDYVEVANFPARGRTVMVGGRMRLR